MKSFLVALISSCCLLGACTALPEPDSKPTAMLQANSNRQIVREFLSAMARGDFDTMRAAMTNDARVTLMVAGVYSPELRAFPRGTSWDRDGAIANEIAFQRALEGRYELDILSLIGDGNHVAAEVVGHGIRAATHQPYFQHYYYHMEISGGRIAAIRLYLDTYHHWEVWDNPGPRPLLNPSLGSHFASSPSA